jgi:DNA-directed RNA polymerase subunit RPC12/RpoP
MEGMSRDDLLDARYSWGPMSMSHNLRPEYRCPKCGATAALLIPEQNLETADVALKCLTCAHITRLPRSEVAGFDRPAGFTGSTD